MTWSRLSRLHEMALIYSERWSFCKQQGDAAGAAWNLRRYRRARRRAKPLERAVGWAS